MDEEEAWRALKEAEEQLKAFQESIQRNKPELAGAHNLTAQPPLCSFCGKGVNQVSRMIEGNGAFICDGCVRQCQGLMEQP